MDKEELAGSIVEKSKEHLKPKKDDLDWQYFYTDIMEILEKGPSGKEIIERILSELRATCLSCNKSYKFAELNMNPYFKEIYCLNPDCKDNKFKLWLEKEEDEI